MRRVVRLDAGASHSRSPTVGGSMTSVPPKLPAEMLKLACAYWPMSVMLTPSPRIEGLGHLVIVAAKFGSCRAPTFDAAENRVSIALPICFECRERSAEKFNTSFVASSVCRIVLPTAFNASAALAAAPDALRAISLVVLVCWLVDIATAWATVEISIIISPVEAISPIDFRVASCTRPICSAMSSVAFAV